MHRAYPTLFALTLVLVFSSSSRSAAEEEETAPSAALEETGTLRDRLGRKCSMQDWPAGHVIALAVVDPNLLPGDDLIKEMSLLEQKHRADAVHFVALYEDAGVNLNEVAQHAMDANLAWFVVRDLGGALTAKLGVTQVPTFLLLDENRRVVYRGALGKADGKEPGLATALAEVLAREPISQAEVPYPGRDRTEPEEESINFRTYSDHVVPVLAAHCQPCHLPGGVAPFSLSTFQDAVVHADLIRDAVLSERMPPPSVDSRFGTFRYTVSLSKAEAKNIVDWLNSGRNPGTTNPRKNPASRVGWNIDAPDVVVTPDLAEKIPPGKELVARYVVVPSEITDRLFETETFANQLECRASNPSAVKHLQAYLFAPGVIPSAERLGEAVATVARTPMGREYAFPEGTSLRVPAKSQVLFEMIVAAGPKEMEEKPSLGIVRAKGPVDSEIRMEVIGPSSLAIERNDPSFVLQEDRRVVRPVELLGVLPVLHLHGKEFRFTMAGPQEEPSTLLQIARFHPLHRSTFWFEEALRLKALTLLAVEGRWDNSVLANRSSPLALARSEPVTVGPFLGGEALQAWVILRVPKESEGTLRFLTNEKLEQVAASMRVLPKDPLALAAPHAARGTVEPATSGVSTWRFAANQATPKEPWNVQAVTRPFAVEDKHLYVARFQARSAEPRKVSAVLDNASKLFQICSDHAPFQVGPEQRPFELSFVAKKSDPSATLNFYIGDAATPIEIEAVSVEDYGDLSATPYKPRQSTKTPIRLKVGSGDDTAMKVEIPEDIDSSIWNAAVYGSSFQAKEGDPYTVSFRARADRIRKLNVALTQDHPPGISVGVGKEVTIIRNWERYTIRGVINRTDSIRLTFFTGGDSTDFELDDIQIEAK